MPSSAPPLSPLALRVGITGHRWRDARDPARGLDPAHADAIRDALRDVLGAIANAALAARAPAAGRWADAPPRLSLVSALAEGADTLAAEVALEHEAGYVVELVVPFDLAAHAPRCAAGTTARAVWDRAESRLVLDGPPGADEALAAGDGVRSEAALVETNRRLVWNSDLLVAVWDGRPARGEAGTARVVERARVEGLPVVHVPAAAPTAWTVLDASGGVPDCESARETLAAVVRRLLAMPATSTSDGQAVLSRALHDYVHERVPGWGVRAVAARVHKLVTFVLSGFDRDASVAALAAAPDMLPVPWHPTPGTTAASTRRAALLNAPFRHADYFATAYAARHRSTFTTILVLAPLAVLCAWGGSVAADALKPRWALGELAALLLLMLVYFRSRRLRFHEKWLDYRLLAERLRHHGYLWMLGRTSPVVRVPTQATFTDPRPAWVNWQYRALTRPLGVPPTAFTPTTLRELAAEVRDGLLQAQLRYCAVTHRIAHGADQRLHWLPWIPLAAAMGAALAHVVTQVGQVPLPPALERWLTPVGVLGPALGAALHGFASQSGFQELGVRTDASAQQLERLMQRLDALTFDEPLASRALGDLVLEIADVLGEDLAGWRVDYLTRPITPPG